MMYIYIYIYDCRGNILHTRNHKFKFAWKMSLKVHWNMPLKNHDDF